MTKLHMLTTVKHRTIVAAVAVVTGTVLAAGAGGSALAATAMPASSTPTTGMTASATGNAQSQAAIDLRVTMNNLLREHVSSSLDVTRNITDHASERQIQAAMQAQYANSDALSAAVGSIYGGAAQAQFSDLFREHIVASNGYASAVAAGDPAAKDAAAAELRSYLNDIANFFSTAIPGLPQQDVYGLLNEHEELINKSTDAFAAGDYVQSYQLEREALKQISRAADALSGGIIATQPAKFQ